MTIKSTETHNPSLSKDPLDASDIKTTGILRYLPSILRPYAKLARLDRPIGTWLLFLPGCWAIALASGELLFSSITPYLFFLFFLIGSLVMRGAGCTWNDITDQDFDKKVARTATRPIPSGEVSTKQALAFLILQCLTGLIILLQFNTLTQIIGASALILVAIYPFMKRITYWPQAWLGLTFNWGIFVGWAAIADNISLSAFFLYTAGFFWTLGYDTIYAHQDKEDDALVGVKSTALKLGKHTNLWLIAFYGLTLFFIIAAAYEHHVSIFSYIFIALGGLHLLWQIITLKIDDAKHCLKLFKSNRDFGFLILIGFMISGL